MVKEIRTAIAAKVEAVTGYTEWPGGEAEIPPGGFFRVRPLGVPGTGTSGTGRIAALIPFDLLVTMQTVPDEPSRLGEAMDAIEALRAALEADITTSTLYARVDVGDATCDYATPGYVTVTMAVGAHTILTA